VNPDADLTGLPRREPVTCGAQAGAWAPPPVNSEPDAGGERGAGWQPADLVHELYLRLLDWRLVHWQNRAHFFSTTARMMRRVLVDMARARRAAKRGQGMEAVPLAAEVAAPLPGVDVVALDDALQALSAMEPRPGQVVELRFFGGFTVDETAEALGVSVRTVINDNTARPAVWRAVSASGEGLRAPRGLGAVEAA
jgi:RNA polymerase sigma factor (TIGR02999 family)